MLFNIILYGTCIISNIYNYLEYVYAGVSDNSTLESLRVCLLDINAATRIRKVTETGVSTQSEYMTGPTCNNVTKVVIVQRY